jgi:predicted Zn-dependent protease
VDQHAEADALLGQATEYYERLAAGAPEAAQPAVDLALVWIARGDLARTAPPGAPAAALGWYDRAAARLEAPPAVGTAAARGALCNAQAGRAMALLAASRLADAAAALERAADLADEPRRSSLRLRRAQVLVIARDHHRAAAIVRELAAARDATGETLDALARVLALAADVAKADAAIANDYAAQSVALLKRAQATGHYRAAQAADRLREDADLTSLRNRADFAEFLRGLEMKD